MIITGSGGHLKSSFMNEVSKNGWKNLINKYTDTNLEVSFEWGGDKFK